MAEPRQQGARQQRVDLVVLGDQDRAAAAGALADVVAGISRVGAVDDEVVSRRV